MVLFQLQLSKVVTILLVEIVLGLLWPILTKAISSQRHSSHSKIILCKDDFLNHGGWWWWKDYLQLRLK